MDTTDLVDLVVDTDEQALDAIKRLLSYLPSLNARPGYSHGPRCLA
jgi:acetyl-CoA carboxylase carboxyltransferase component